MLNNIKFVMFSRNTTFSCFGTVNTASYERKTKCHLLTAGSQYSLVTAVVRCCCAAAATPVYLPEQRVCVSCETTRG